MENGCAGRGTAVAFSIEDLTDGEPTNLLLKYLTPPVFGATAAWHIRELKWFQAAVTPPT
jgi:hypothetical protein